MGANAPQQPVVPEALQGSSLTVDGETVEVRGNLEANNAEVILELTRAGHGIALMPTWLVFAASVSFSRTVITGKITSCGMALPCTNLAPPAK